MVDYMDCILSNISWLTSSPGAFQGELSYFLWRFCFLVIATIGLTLCNRSCISNDFPQTHTMSEVLFLSIYNAKELDRSLLRFIQVGQLEIHVRRCLHHFIHFFVDHSVQVESSNEDTDLQSSASDELVNCQK